MATPRLLVPALVTAVAGTGLDFIGNIAPSAFPQAPHWVWVDVFYIAVACWLTLPAWLVWWSINWLTHKNTGSELDHTVVLASAWAQLPATVPEGDFSYIQLSNYWDAFGTSRTSLQPGSRMNWDPTTYPTSGIKCTVSNYGDTAIVRADFDLRVEFLELVKTPEGATSSGDSIKTVTIRSPRMNLGMGTSVFYIINLGDTFVRITPADTVRIQRAGSAETQTAKLSLAPDAHFELYPVEVMGRQQPAVLSFQEAAQIAYERAEKEGWLNSVIGHTPSDPSLRLESFKYMMLVQAQHHVVTLHGIEPPSTQSLPIPQQKTGGLHPIPGGSALRHLSPNQIAFEKITISRDDLEKVIGIYQALATHREGAMEY